MNLAETELKIGNTSFKGVYIAILLSLATTLGSGIWAASTLYSRLVDVEARSIPNVKPLEERVGLIEQELEDNSVSSLQGKLAELGTNLEAIMEAQKELLDLRDRVAAVEKSNAEAVLRVDNRLESLKDTNERLKRIQKEIDDIWLGLDSIANPLG